MPASLIDTLREINYPITILADYPTSGSEAGADEFMQLVAKTGFKDTVSLKIDYENSSPWDDKIIEAIPEGNGLLIVSIGLKDKVWDFILAAQYTPNEVTKLPLQKGIASMLHARCHIIHDITEPLPLFVSNQSAQKHSASLSPDSAALEEILILEKNHCLFSTETKAVYFFKGKEAPALLRLIGIGRSITFEAIGAGSGLEVDLAPEDEYYDHVMLWDKQAQCLVGAYRIGFTEEIISKYGVNGLYLNSIFNFKKEYYEQLGNSMELSRSFILPLYQKNPQMLDALWKGVGQIAVRRNCFNLYGSVTISASFTPLSQSILVDTLDRYHGEEQQLRNTVTTSHPFIPQTKNHQLVSNAWAEMGINRLNTVIEDIEHNQRPIPPLVRYYISLKAKFLAFQVEASFNNAIYCLLRVNFKTLPSRYKKRFFGK